MPNAYAPLFSITALAVFPFVSLAGWAQAPFERQLDLPSAVQSGRVSQLIALDAGATFPFLELEGPGAITHIWMTMGKHDLRNVIIRMFWDDETEPSVEAPLADFFGVGHGLSAPEAYFATPCLAVAPTNGYNCYFPMPFAKNARIAITNDNEALVSDGGGIYFQADYVRFAELDADTPRFHAQWRRDPLALRRGRPHSMIETTGKGFVAGVTLHVHALDQTDKWFHGGGDFVYIDGATAPAMLKGIGGEDFFGQSWHNDLFQTPYAGCYHNSDERISMYRFFLEGPPVFNESIRVAYGALENEITSVAYWYQTEPHSRFTTLPPPASRLPGAPFDTTAYDIEVAAEEQLDVAIVGPFAGTIETAMPLDGIEAVELGRALRTNYPKPFKVLDDFTGGGGVKWERERTILGWLDFEAAYRPKWPEWKTVSSMPGTVAFALLRITADKARKPTLSVGHDDAVQVWVNGAEAAKWEAGPAFVLDEAALPLRAGPNDVVIKVENAWNTNFAAWAISLALEGTEGLELASFQELEPVPGVAPAPAAPMGPPPPDVIAEEGEETP